VRLDAYYYGFDATGEHSVDVILSAVACAGKAFHHTESWTDDSHVYEPDHHRGANPVEWIQNAANAARTELAALRRRAEDAEAMLRAVKGTWTKEPPTESGWFWVKLWYGNHELVLFDHEMFWFDRIHWREPTRFSAFPCGESLPVFTGEWWSERVAPPEDTDEAREALK